ncbi:hypothetical protein BMW23_0818 [Bodo saltans virus]|uniref:Uncharacterized protein n=1 Tax=Bodo saltans virus TaxID=2024608 RepID=A0A2H4UVH0_9VIRU|nr:hypothetical protein QJ851_gp0801 [Bodo saltans virus]ATZ80864.1 hypothetical protein BMW23_0818 [Bodo saltans virus]
MEDIQDHHCCGELSTYIKILLNDCAKCHSCKNKLHDLNKSYTCVKCIKNMDEVIKNGNYYYTSYFVDDDECNNCGNRNMSTYYYVNIPIDEYDSKTNYLNMIKKCKCRKISKYELKLNDDIICSKCKNIKIKKDTLLNLCSSRCAYCDWYIKKYFSEPGQINFKAIFSKHDVKCSKCEHIEHVDGIFEGILYEDIKKIAEINEKKKSRRNNKYD